jgi:hypothetical protein
MRFDNGYIKQVVIGEAVILVGLGFAPGARQLNPVLVSQRVSLAFGTVFGKCINSALLTLASCAKPIRPTSSSAYEAAG